MSAPTQDTAWLDSPWAGRSRREVVAEVERLRALLRECAARILTYRDDDDLLARLDAALKEER